VSWTGGEEVGNWTLKHAITVPSENNDSVSGGKPKLFQTFCGVADFSTLGHNVETAHVDPEILSNEVGNGSSCETEADGEDSNSLFC
jgi:hypothetical protein